jgi:hypothetical protein
VATNDPQGFGANDPAAHGSYGFGGEEGEEPEPVPGWRTPVALAGWGLLIAVLIGLIIWGTLELMHGSDATSPTTTATTTTATTKSTTPTTTTTTATTTSTTTTPAIAPPSPPTDPSDTITSSTRHKLPFPHGR